MERPPIPPDQLPVKSWQSQLIEALELLKSKHNELAEDFTSFKNEIGSNIGETIKELKEKVDEVVEYLKIKDAGFRRFFHKKYLKNIFKSK